MVVQEPRVGLPAFQNLDPLAVPQDFDLKAVDRVGVDGLVGPVFAAGKDRLQNHGDHLQKLAPPKAGAANDPEIDLMWLADVHTVHDVPAIDHAGHHDEPVIGGRLQDARNRRRGVGSKDAPIIDVVRVARATRDRFRLVVKPVVVVLDGDDTRRSNDVGSQTGPFGNGRLDTPQNDADGMTALRVGQVFKCQIPFKAFWA